MMKPGLVLVALSACVASACAGGSSASGRNVVCMGALAAPGQLLYPAPGATNVPDGNFSMVLGFALPSETISLANGSNTTSLGTPGPAPTPLPTPTATPLDSGETLSGVAVPALAAQTTYTVNATEGYAPCTAIVPLGSFTTR